MQRLWNGLVVAARTSEFWAALLVAALEALQAPVPAELAGEYETAKVVALVYAGLRVWSKVVKKIPEPTTPTEAK